MKMKVCFVLCEKFSSLKGGSELQAMLLSNQMALRDIEVSYVYYGSKTSIIPEIIDKVRYFSVKKPFKSFSIFNYLNYSDIYKLIEHIGPDTVYQRGISNGAIFQDICQKLKINFFLHITKNDQCNPLTSKSWFERNIKYYGIQRLLRKSNIVSQTNIQKQLLEENFGLSSRVITNGYNIPPQKTNKKLPIILWVANLKKWKRPEIFINLAKDLGSINVKLLVVGRNSNNDYSNSIVNSINSSSNMKYLGELEIEDVDKIFEKSIIFVNTSLPFEGFPNTFIQSWIHRTAVVSLNFDPDNILESKGLGIHAGSYNRLVRSVKKLVLNPDKRKSFVDKSEKYVFQNHDISETASRLLEYFGEA